MVFMVLTGHHLDCTIMVFMVSDFSFSVSFGSVLEKKCDYGFGFLLETVLPDASTAPGRTKY